MRFPTGRICKSRRTSSILQHIDEQRLQATRTEAAHPADGRLVQPALHAVAGVTLNLLVQSVGLDDDPGNRYVA